jgi:hypothetical protein
MSNGLRWRVSRPDPDAIVVSRKRRVGGVALAAYGFASCEGARTPCEEQLLRYLDDARRDWPLLGRGSGSLPLAVNDTQDHR